MAGPFPPGPTGEPTGSGGFAPPPSGFQTQPGYPQPGYPQPGYPQPGYGPGPGPQPPPKSNTGKGCLIAFLVVLALAIVAAVVIAVFFSRIFGGILDLGQAVVENATTVGEPAGGIGDTVSVEGTEFVVRSFTCGLSAADLAEGSELPVAPPSTGPAAEFCLAKVSARNETSNVLVFTGTEAQAFMNAEDTNPVQSVPSLSSTSGLSGLGELDPGASTEVDYVFDVPKGAHPEFLKLHAGWADPTTSGGSLLPGALGPGVTVKVR